MRGWLEPWRFSRCLAAVPGVTHLREPQPTHLSTGLRANLREQESSRPSETCGLVLEGMELAHHLSLLLSFLSTPLKHKRYILGTVFLSSITFLLILFSPLRIFPSQHWLDQNTKKKKKNPTFCFLNTNCWYLYSDLAKRGEDLCWQKDCSY